MNARLVPTGKQCGVFRILLSHLGYPADRWWIFVEKYGPIVLGSNAIITTFPEHIKTMVTADPNNYVKGEGLYEAMDLLLGSSVFNSPANMWKFHRTITRPFFNRNREMHLKNFKRHAENLVAQIKHCMAKSQTLDFQDLVRYSTLNIATDFLFGRCVSNLPYPPQGNSNTTFPLLPITEFSAALLRVQDVISERERLGWVWPLYEMLGDKTKKSLEIIERNLDPIIQEAFGKKMMRGMGIIYHRSNGCSTWEDNGEPLLDHLVELTADPELVKSAILNTLIVGRVGTATTLTHLVYFLARNPIVVFRLRKEIIEQVGSTRIPTDDDIGDLKYLRAVINETLRLVPQVQYITRETAAATTWVSPDPSDKRIYLPAYTRILFDISALHTSKDLWGPDANEFDPDRFIDYRFERYLAPNPHIFLPFGARPRTCLSKDFPYDEISMTTIEILRRFSNITISPSPFNCHKKTDDPNMMGVSQELEGLWVKMETD